MWTTWLGFGDFLVILSYSTVNPPFFTGTNIRRRIPSQPTNMSCEPVTTSRWKKSAGSQWFPAVVLLNHMLVYGPFPDWRSHWVWEMCVGKRWRWKRCPKRTQGMVCFGLMVQRCRLWMTIYIECLGMAAVTFLTSVVRGHGAGAPWSTCRSIAAWLWSHLRLPQVMIVQMPLWMFMTMMHYSGKAHVPIIVSGLLVGSHNKFPQAEHMQNKNAYRKLALSIVCLIDDGVSGLPSRALPICGCWSKSFRRHRVDLRGAT